MKTSGKSWAKYIDKSIKAKKSGWRTSASGERYYEDRPNHSDVSRKDKYAHGGMTEHGLEVGDLLLSKGRKSDEVVGMNREKHELFTTDLDKGKREVKKTSLMAKGGKTKKAKEPMVVRSYFEDEAIDYGSGGAIYKGDKVKIKDTNKSMVVKSIAKGKKGYVEFTGDAGTYLKGDLEKFEEGGMTSGWCYSIGGL